MDETRWRTDPLELGRHHGYEFAWAPIAGSTIAQLAFFRWKKWI